MPYEVTVDDATGVVIVAVEGMLGFEEVCQGIRNVLETPGLSNDVRVLWDFRCGSAAGLDAENLRAIARFEAERRPRRTHFRLAFLVGRDIDFGLARMVGVFSEDEAIEQRVFRDHDEAWSWVLGAP